MLLFAFTLFVESLLIGNVFRALGSYLEPVRTGSFNWTCLGACWHKGRE